MKIQATKKVQIDRRFIYIFIGLLGLLLVFLPSLTKEEITSPTFSNEYGEYLETRLENTLSCILGKDSIDIFITFQNTYNSQSNQDKQTFNIFESQAQNQEDIQQPLPKIAGVLIVCKNIHNSDDFKALKKAAAVALDINEKKINIIGGKLP